MAVYARIDDGVVAEMLTGDYVVQDGQLGIMAHQRITQPGKVAVERTVGTDDDGAPIVETVEQDTIVEVEGLAFSPLFHPDLVWLDVSNVSGIAEGWRHDGKDFTPPPPPPPPPKPEVTKADLLAQLAALQAQVEALPS